MKDGQYDAAENLTDGSFDKENLRWEIVPQTPSVQAAINEDTGIITFANTGESFTVKATSLDETTVFVQFTLTVVKLGNMTVSEAPLAPDSKSTSQATITVEPAGRTIHWSFDGASLGCVIDKNTGLITAGDQTGWITIIASDSELDYCVRRARLRIACTSCSGSGGSCAIGQDFMMVDSINVSFGMGSGLNGKSAGDIQLFAEDLSTNLYSPRSLEFYLSRSDVEVIRDAGDSLRQVKAPQGLADLVTIDNAKYEIRFYNADQAGSKNGEGLYAPTGSAFLAWVIENPDALEGLNNRLRLTKVAGGASVQNEFRWNENDQRWELSRGGGLQVESVTESWDTAHEYRTTERTVKDSEDLIASKTRERYFTAPWGEVPVESVQDPDGSALTNTTIYYENSAESGKYTQVQAEIDPNGAWRLYDYDTQGRMVERIEPWKDSILTASPDNDVVEQYDFTPLDTEDVLSGNDRRPRTMVKTIDDVTVAKSFFVYKTTTDGDVTITEQAVRQDAEYGDSDNLRSISVEYPTNHSNQAAAGKMKSSQTPDGRLESYSYELGTFVPGSTPDGDSFVAGSGTDVRVSAVHGTVEHPSGIANKTTKDVRIQNELGRTLYEESYVYTGSGYERISWTKSTYDVLGHLTESLRSNGTRRQSTWGSACCGQDSETDENGMTTLYSYDQLGRLLNSTKAGVAAADGFPAQADVTTAHQYDAAGRRLAQIISAGGLSLTNREQYDLVGRVTNSVDSAGVGMRTTYSAGERIVTVIRPGGATEVTEQFRDGRVKNVTGTGVAPLFYDYGVNADGSQWTLIRTGREDSPVWEKTTTDFAGRVVKTEKPGFGGGVVTNLNVYNEKGQLIRSSSPGLADTLYVYDELGNQIRQGLDINDNETLDLASMDRINESDSSYVFESNTWWQVGASKGYPKDNDSNPIVMGTQKQRLSGFPDGVIEDSYAFDLLGNITHSATYLDRTNKRLTRETTYPDSSTNEVSVSVNGLPQFVASKSGVRQSYQYDALGRQTGLTTPRTGAAITHYNAKGQVDYVEDSDHHRTTYTYDSTTGARIAVSDPLGNTIHTAFDPQGRTLATWGATYPVAYEYDDYGRMSALYTYRGVDEITSYSEIGNRKSEMDRTTWSYDPATGLLTNKQDATGKGAVYSYTLDGKLSTRTWARKDGDDPLVTTYFYNPMLGVMTNIDYSDATPDVAYAYYRSGQQSSISDILGVRHFEYNDSLQLTNEVLPEVPTLGYAPRIARLYDDKGRQSQMMLGSPTNPLDYHVIWSYDTYGRFRRVNAHPTGVDY
ncbi:MAG: hypothetical protein V2A34_13555, partial [Lentisphaerota bacterium]